MGTGLLRTQESWRLWPRLGVVRGEELLALWVTFPSRQIPQLWRPRADPQLSALGAGVRLERGRAGNMASAGLGISKYEKWKPSRAGHQGRTCNRPSLCMVNE